MAVQKKNKYIEQDIEWLEKKLSDHKAFVDARPFAKLKDRYEKKLNKDGLEVNGRLVASIEAQRQDLSKALAEVASLLEAIDKLKTEEEKKKMAIRGDEELTPMESGEIG